MLSCPFQLTEIEVATPSDGYVAGYTPPTPLLRKDSDNFVHQVEADLARIRVPPTREQDESDDYDHTLFKAVEAPEEQAAAARDWSS